jgi:hypothetical protein
MAEVTKSEYPAGEHQLIVLFMAGDLAEEVDHNDLLAEVARDAAEREAAG